MKSRKLIQLIRSVGAERVRGKGDHEIFKFPGGQLLSVPQGGSRSEAPEVVLSKARRILGSNFGR